MIIIGFSMVICAYLSLLTKNKYKVYFCILAMLSTIAATGAYYPIIGELYWWLFYNIPFFHSTTYFHYTLALCYVAMLGILLQHLLRPEAVNIILAKTQKQLRHLLTAITITFFAVMIIAIDLPVFTGYGFPGHNVVIPEDYYEIRQILLQRSYPGDKLFVVSTPSQWGQYRALVWGTYAIDPVQKVSPIPLIGVSLTLLPDTPEWNLLMFFRRGEIDSAIPILSGQGVRFILLHKDIWDNDHVWDVSQIQNELRNRPQFFMEISNSKYLSLYEFNSIHLTPFIYTVQDDSFYQVYSYSPDISSKVSFDMVNPTYYMCNINTTEPFVLVFNQKFNREWTIFVNGIEVSLENHFMTKEDMNAWHVEKTGQSVIEIRYRPQMYVYIGSLISVFILLYSILYMAINLLRRRNWIERSYLSPRLFRMKK